MKISIKHQIELIHRLTMSKFLRLYLGLAILFSSFTVAAQAPEGINYQAVARDLNGNSLSNTMITVRFGILSGSANGTLEYEEEYLMVTTNDFGLFNLVIGGGVNTNNGIRADFSEIDWGSNAHFLRVEVNNEVLSNTQLISVPYALYAKRSGNQFKAGPGIEILNNDSIVNIGDLSDTNELQNLFVNAAQDSILINPGSGIAVSDLILPDDQQLNLSNDTLFLTGDNPSTVPLLPILGLDSLSAIDDTTLRAFYANGNSFDIVLRGADTSNVNELVDSLVLNNATLELYQQGGLQAAIDLDTLGNGKRDSLIDALSRLEVRLVADSARVTDSITDIRADLDLHLNNDRDTSVTNELINSILLNGTVLEIADSGGTFLTDLSSLIGTDNQNLRLNLGRDSILIDRGNGLSIAFILDSIVSLEGKFVADSTAKADSIALLRSGLDSLTVRYLNDSTSNADSLAALRAELNLINVVFQDTSEINELVNSFTLSGTDLTLIDSGGTYTVDLSVLPSINTDDQNLSLNAAQDSILIEDGSGVSIAFILDSLSAQRADIDQNQLDIDDNQDSLALLRLDVNQNRTNIGINTDSLVAHRTDINQNRTDIGVNADSLAVHRIDINQNRSDISIVNDTLAVHRTDININRDTLEDIRGEFNQLRGRYLNDSTANADSLADQRAEFNQLRIRYLADSTAKTDSLIAHRIDINSNRDTLVDIRGEFNQLRGRYLNDSTANADSLANHRIDINLNRTNLSSLEGRYLSDSTLNADTLAAHRTDINLNRSDINDNRDSLVVHRTDINQNRTDIGIINDTLPVLRTDINFNRRELDSLQVRFAADSTNNADSLVAIRSDLNQHIALDNDTSASNEVNASVVLNGTDLEVTDAAGTIITDLSPLTAPDVVVDGSSALRLAYWKNIDTLSFFDDFYLDTANLRIGLGTTTPDSKFHLAEDIDAGFAEFRIENLNAQDGSQIVFEESGQGNNFTLRYRSTSAGAGNWFQILGDQETVVGLIVERDRGDVGIGIPIDTDPEAKLEVAGAVKVEAAGLTPVEGMIQYVGSDFQGYDGTQWRSFIDTATCPAGMTNINGRICMETNERAAATWFQAATDCVTDGYKLPNRAEWYGAASNAGLINETGNWEWVDNTDINNVGKVGNTTLQSYATDNPTNTEAFRCMLYLK